MQMPKYYEDTELVNLLGTYLKQDPNSKQYFSFLNLINDDCYRADFILKWFYDENEFWDNINNQIITDRFNAMNNCLEPYNNTFFIFIIQTLTMNVVSL